MLVLPPRGQKSMNAPFSALEKVLHNYCSGPFLTTLVNCIHMFFSKKETFPF